MELTGERIEELCMKVLDKIKDVSTDRETVNLFSELLNCSDTLLVYKAVFECESSMLRKKLSKANKKIKELKKKLAKTELDKKSV